MTDRAHRRQPSDPKPTDEARKGSDSSVLFSLRELMDLEQGRVEDERAREERARIEANRAKMEAELRIAAADEARRRADAERRRAEELARKEEDARLEALRLAAVERARCEAIERGRLEQLAATHRHEEQLLKLKAESDRVRLKRTAIGLLAVAITAGAGALGYYLGVVRPRVEAEHQALATRGQQLDAEVRAQADGLERLDATSAQLRRDLETIESAPPAVTAAPSAPLSARPLPTVAGPRPTSAPTAQPNSKPCNKHDPLDPCLE